MRPMIRQKRIRTCMLQRYTIAMVIIVAFIGIVMADDGIADGTHHNVEPDIHQEETVNTAPEIPPPNNQNNHVPLYPDDIPVGESENPTKEPLEVVETPADFTDHSRPTPRDDENVQSIQEQQYQQHPNDMHLQVVVEEEAQEATTSNETIEPQQPEEQRTETRASGIETSLDNDDSRRSYEVHANMQATEETKQFETQQRVEMIDSQKVLDVESGQDSADATQSLESKQLPEQGQLHRVEINDASLVTEEGETIIHSDNMQVQDGTKTKTPLPEVDQAIQSVVENESSTDAASIQSAASRDEDSQTLSDVSPPPILSTVDDSDLTSTGSTDNTEESLDSFSTSENSNSPLDLQGFSSQAEREKEKSVVADSEESRDEKLSNRHATEPREDQQPGPENSSSEIKTPKKGSLAEFFQQASKKDKERKNRILEAESLNNMKGEGESFISVAKEDSSAALGEDELMKLLGGKYPQPVCSYWGNSRLEDRKRADLTILLQLFHDLVMGEEDLHNLKSPKEAAFESAGEIFKHSSLNLKEEVVQSFLLDSKDSVESKDNVPGKSASKDSIVIVDEIDKLFMDVTSLDDSETNGNDSSLHEVFVRSAIDMFIDRSKLGFLFLKKELIQLNNAIVTMMKNKDGEWAPLRKLRDANGELVLLLPFRNERGDFAPFHRLRTEQGEINPLFHLKNEKGELSVPSKEQLVEFGKTMKSASIKLFHKVEDFIKHLLEEEDVEIELDDFDFEFLSQDGPKEPLS